MLLVVALGALACVAALWLLADRYGRMLSARHEERAAASAASGPEREVVELVRVREEVARAVQAAPEDEREEIAAAARDRALGGGSSERRRHERVSELYRAWLQDPGSAPRAYAEAFARHRERLARSEPAQPVPPGGPVRAERRRSSSSSPSRRRRRRPSPATIAST
jgi:hypothetical protein